MIINDSLQSIDHHIKLVINNQKIFENVSIELTDCFLIIKGQYQIDKCFIKEMVFNSSILSLWILPFNKLQFSGNHSFLSQIYNQLSQRTQKTIIIKAIEPNYLTLEEELNHLCNKEKFKITNINQDYTVCDSLSKFWVIPKSINDTLLKHAARFRAKNRLPILSYIHGNGTVLIRSSQPLCGLGYKRSVQDEKLIQEFVKGTNLVIIDARSAASALANAMTGKGGSELESHYNAQKRIFLHIENVHHVRRAEQEIFENINLNDWIVLLNKILESSFVVAEEMLIGSNSVLLHCSDGWDRTAQLVSLVQILLDRRYRTKRGLWMLIEKEWLSSGHQFSKRMSISNDSHDIEEQGNIFGQFINILWLFCKSQQSCFEWDEDYLAKIWKESCDPQGYFNGNNERTRKGKYFDWIIINEDLELISLDIEKLKKIEMELFYPTMELFHP
jgi:hypothetical protein